jgi:Putative nucleotidyltransferase substrate binding domain
VTGRWLGFALAAALGYLAYHDQARWSIMFNSMLAGGVFVVTLMGWIDERATAKRLRRARRAVGLTRQQMRTIQRAHKIMPDLYEQHQRYDEIDLQRLSPSERRIVRDAFAIREEFGVKEER